MLAAGELWVARRKGATIGFAGRLLRDGVSFLTGLFVGLEAQPGGTGTALPRAAYAMATLPKTVPSGLFTWRASWVVAACAATIRT